MRKDLIICVAPCPGELQSEKFPGRLDVVREAVGSYNAGASIVHLHVRDNGGLQTDDTGRFRRDVEAIRAACPIIIEGSTGGTPEHSLEQRSVALEVPHVEVASLNLGSVNMWGGVYSNKNEDILFYAAAMKRRKIRPFLTCFDLSHFSALARLSRQGLLAAPYSVGLVFDIPDALPYSDRYLDIFLNELPEGSEWTLVRYHARGAAGFAGALGRGGNIRVGFEDGPFLSDGRRARCNAELVSDIAREAKKAGRQVVGPERARELLGLTGSDSGIDT